MSASVRLDVHDGSHVAEARRQATRLAPRPEFGEIALGGLAIVATELATNLLKHAGGGELVMRVAQVGGVPVVELLALDRGPGIGNVGESLRDGFSTTGSLGTGLGAVRRLSATFNLYTAPGGGTAVLSRVAAGPLPRPPDGRRIELGAVCLPLRGEEGCGDAFAVQEDGAAVHIFLVDGLGHGMVAAQAAREAVRIFDARGTRGPGEVLQMAHDALKTTRGAAAGIAEIVLGRDAVRFAGVGNTVARLIGEDGIRNLVSLNGTLGADVRRIQESAYPWPGGLLVMHSDGLSARWALEDYPGLQKKDPALVAGVLYRDHARGRDDATVVVATERHGAP